ncbi:MAG TPA: hypothetical protein VHV47_13575, partial [Opitutaceae bacterium]|nr:hypothetical protein [Opitutaceae bacterium]
MPTPATADPACLRSRLETWLAVFLIAAVLAFQAWTAWSTDRAWLVDGRRDDYNNQLLHSFLAGHLYLPETPDPRLAQLANPYDPALRPADVATPHDGSYYHGHFYMYFGVTPIVTLLLPWRLLVGHDLPQVWAVVFFVWGGFLAASALFLSLRRRFFPESGAVTLVAGLVVLGLGSMTHAVLRRSGVWEAAIAPGYCFAMLMLLCLYRGLHSCRPAGWLAAAGAAFGLAVGARPIYVLGGAALLVPLIRAAALGRRELIRQALALALGAGPIAAGLAWYNWARFGSPLEFGNHYMMNAANEQAAVHFSLRYLPYNFYAYFLAPLPFGRYFPFVGLARLPAQPDGYYGVEYVSGLLVNFPFAWLAVLVPLGWRGRAAAEAGELRRFLTALAIFFAGVAALEACWWAATARYMADFTPALMLLAAAGMLGAERAARGRGRALVRTGAAAAALFTAFVGAMLSFQLHELLRQLYPQTFDRVAHVFDTPVAWVERLAGERFEPREITLRFPIGKGGLVEPLVTAGWEFQSDHLFVHYYDAGHVRFGYDHAGHGALWSGP